MKMLQRTAMTDDHVRRLLRTSATSKDPRSQPCCTLMLWQSLTLHQVDSLDRKHLDLDGRLLSVPTKHGRRRLVTLTELVHRQLLDIPPSSNVLLFAPPSTNHPSIFDLFERLLYQANLSNLVSSDFPHWSLAQTDAVRLSTATA
jgi:hypothetical protein